MTHIAGAPVVVGIDGSPSSLDAVEMAAGEALLRQAPLHLVHALVWPASLASVRPASEGAPEPAALIRAHIEAVVAEAKTRAAKEAPDVPVTAEVVDGPAAYVLLQRSRRAALVLIGDRGLGRFEGMLAGTVATQLATYGSSPVVVVKSRPKQDQPVVVGVDGSARSLRAVEFAADEAALRGAELVAVHVWRTPPVAGAGDMMPLVYDLDRLEAEEGRVLATAVAGVAERHPGLSIRQELLRGPVGPALAARSRRAQLLVVGDRGHGGFVGLLIGSVSQHLIYHAACPIVVIRG
ncbi:universal stress protein [Actinoplanes sp. L3-i22]|uniref:universal stress protein n=1 Tax=Actinoplanes sp. L3-i22 TaxID=2836373 RepID=UPI001C77666E|nr:universal stress protein [Actinoplanes sp. L3-i22]BCY09296.1 universal stress protein [Actinoplanes sp. L3-i22]